MPDENGNLSDPELAKVDQWITNHPTCPTCRNKSERRKHPQILTLPSGISKSSPDTMKALAVDCLSCGTISLLNARVADID